MVKEVKTKVNQSDARAIEVMPMLIATGLVTYEGENPHSERLELPAWGVRQFRVRAREMDRAQERQQRDRLRGQEAPFRSGLSKGKLQVKAQMGASGFFFFCIFFIMLDIEAKSSHLLGKWSTAELDPLPLFLFLTYFYHRCLSPPEPI